MGPLAREAGAGIVNPPRTSARPSGHHQQLVIGPTTQARPTTVPLPTLEPSPPCVPVRAHASSGRVEQHASVDSPSFAGRWPGENGETRRLARAARTHSRTHARTHAHTHRNGGQQRCSARRRPHPFPHLHRLHHHTADGSHSFIRLTPPPAHRSTWAAPPSPQSSPLL
ncbi:hypothetical protein DFH27DRAFT_248523 [Peziza echinospora]|nr:hypothetical protein DFH27DRAFT_248523 [Peziza echinospora]